MYVEEVFFSEARTVWPLPYSDWYSSHRESFCQSWSIILILNEIEKLINKGGFTDNVKVYKGKNVQLLDEWASLSRKELEICIRRFILWIVWKYPADFQNTYEYDNVGEIPSGIREKFPKYKNLLLRYMKDFDLSLSVPKRGTSMCDNISANA